MKKRIEIRVDGKPVRLMHFDIIMRNIRSTFVGRALDSGEISLEVYYEQVEKILSGLADRRIRWGEDKDDGGGTLIDWETGKEITELLP